MPDAASSARTGGRFGPRAFEFFLGRAEPVLARLHGRDVAREVIADTRVEHARLEPKVPDIGGTANVFQPVMLLNGWLVALHFAMKKRGKTAADAVEVFQTVADELLRTIPGPVLRAVGRLLLSSPVRRYFASQAARSQNREFDADFVWTVESTPDGEFSFVFDECAVNKRYEVMGVEDLKPHCNFFDVTYSRLMNMGVDATETIGKGCTQCALRFKPGRETRP